MEQAETRADEANILTRQAEALTVQANTRTDEANIRTDEANTRTEHAEARHVQSLVDSGISYRRLFETAQDGILILDAGTGQVVDANPFMKHLLGYSQEEFLGRKLWEIGPFKGEAASKVAFAQLQRQDRLHYEGLPLETKDGRHVEVEFTSNAYLEGTKQLIQCNIRDMTERKQTEQLRASLKEIVDLKCALDEHAIVAITDPRGKITHVNDKFCAISKYSREELIGQDHRIINSGYHSKEFILELWSTITHGRVWHGEIKNRAKDGSFYWVDTTIVPFLSEDGKPRQYVAIRADITERKAAEKKIRELNAGLEGSVVERTAQLQNANDELQAFSYSVSHDLRAPLRHVIGFVQLLQTEAGSSLSEKGGNYLTTISQAAKRMGNLIDDLLSFSQIGRSEMKNAQVSLDELVQETVGDFAVELKDRKVVWDIHPLPMVQCDRALLRMVVVNLISNAIKFTAHRTETRIEIGTRAHGDSETVVFIRDNGVGFDPRYVGKLFGVFQRLHSASEFEGTGIGLANVQRIIHRHGGRVWAEGAVDDGATFYFSLPVQTNSKND